MLSIVLLLATAALLEAKPSTQGMQISFSHMIVGGVDAARGEFPWQLSQQRSGSHSCGASLLDSRRGLSAAHCVDAAVVSTLNVIAGLHQRSDLSGTQQTGLNSYTMHEEYNSASATYANDIAILNFASSISPGGNIEFATLPSDNSNDFTGTTCVISGWGRTSSSNTLPDTLQKANIQVISGTQCQSSIGSIGTIWSGHICLLDSAGDIGSCNGDSGGPLNCPSGGSTVVAGVTSWGVSLAGNCRQNYPSVYTRTSAYLSWINQ